MQFGRNHRFGNVGSESDPGESLDTLLQRIKDDLSLLRSSDSLLPQAVLITGDLAEQGAKTEMDDALDFLQGLTTHLNLSPREVFLIPGNHDINRKLSEAYHAECEGEGVHPKPPFWSKWRHFHRLFTSYYKGNSDITFSEEVPWTLYENSQLRMVVAGMNSTILESHLPDSHYGWVSEGQMRWFADKLAAYRDRGWLRVVAVHHNIFRGAIDDEENLRDADLFKRIVGPLGNIFFHGHTHRDGLDWIDTNIPVLSTGSAALNTSVLPAELSNQYQLIKLSKHGFERWTRRYDGDQKRWIADTRCSTDGSVGYQKKHFQFSYIFGTFEETIATASNGNGEVEDKRIVRLDKPLGAGTAGQKLANVPRFTLSAEPQHLAIRSDQRQDFCTIFNRERIVWLVSDWGLGKEGFLASALQDASGKNQTDPTFRLICSGLDEPEDLLREAEIQLGMSFQEFAAAVSALPSAVIVFDDLPDAFVNGPKRGSFEDHVLPLCDFGPNIRLIFCCRIAPASHNLWVKLSPLDESDVRVYLTKHSKSVPDLDIDNELLRIHLWSGGLPMHLDRLLQRAPYIPPSEILEEDTQTPLDGAAEPVPESLKAAVATLASSEHAHQRNSYRLLKVLTVLRDGETFSSIKRFYKIPFHQSNIDELINLELLETIPISQTAADLRLRRSASSGVEETPKLLRLPRPVRDYINSILPNSERTEIMSTSTWLFFGSKWWSGKIRLRTSITNAYGLSAMSGPGNEHLIARQLLVRAIESKNEKRIEKNARLALSYCQKLLANDRFRDALVASQGIVPLLRETHFRQGFAEAAEMCAHALRMMGRHDEAIRLAQEALDKGEGVITDDFKAQTYITIALAQKTLGQKEAALKSAESVVELAHKDSGESCQGKAIVAELTLEGHNLTERLKELESFARNRSKLTAANNIAIDLARTSSSPEESVRWLEKVIYSSKDPYNRTRAIVERASIFGDKLRASELRDEDYRMISAAYSYSYSQRIGNLLDRCHTVLWGMFKRSSLLGALLRLFRFSSFIWRVRGTDEEELKYLQDLDGIDLVVIRKTEGNALQNEILYLEQRRRHRNRPLDDSGWR